MQRRYPGRQGERGGPPDWQERGERAYRGAGKHGIPDDAASRQDDDDASAYRRFANEDVGPEDWGSEWSERSARPAAEQRSRGYGADWHGEPGASRHVAWETERGPGRHGESRAQYSGDRPEFRGHHRPGWYGGERDDDPRYGGGARDVSRFGGDAEREALRHRRGPKGYTRSDERIREDVCERLAHALDIDVSDVEVQVHDGRVELDGTVPARWMKHDIEDIADNCMCVRDVENRVRVRRDGEHDTGMVLHPDQRTVTPTEPVARDPEPGSTADRDREPRH
ncbi:transporter [Burkholderia pyrrocinia]|uniref:Transporter n=1 Tax=Burkholderia pyrrocinia TaxID=60550 RepID=A0A2Z5NBB2_BURPY|nr:BON domain-containing protein [Burkholderia pyrrocinia]AXF25647.1 transporter [Burkholderia pyrrocinia]